MHLLSLIRFSNVRYMLCFLAGELGRGRKKKGMYVLVSYMNPKIKLTKLGRVFFSLIPIELGDKVKKCAV